MGMGNDMGVLMTVHGFSLVVMRVVGISMRVLVGSVVIIPVGVVPCLVIVMVVCSMCLMVLCPSVGMVPNLSMGMRVTDHFGKMVVVPGIVLMGDRIV